VSAGLLDETLAELDGSSSGNSSSCSSAATCADPGSTPVLITYGDRDEVVARQRVDRWVAA
jgi:hypothetical protein